MSLIIEKCCPKCSHSDTAYYLETKIPLTIQCSNCQQDLDILRLMSHGEIRIINTQNEARPLSEGEVGSLP